MRKTDVQFLSKLKTKLTSYGLSTAQVESVLGLVKKQVIRAEPVSVPRGRTGRDDHISYFKPRTTPNAQGVTVMTEGQSQKGDEFRQRRTKSKKRGR